MTASRGESVSSERRVGSSRSRPIGASIRPRHERGVAPLQLAALNELLQPLVRLVGAGYDEQPGRVAIEPVDDSGPVLRPTRGPAGEPVDERARRVARTRMHDDAGGLFHDEQVVVLVRDAEIDLLGLDLAGGLGRKLHLQVLAALEPVALRPRTPVDSDVAALDEPLRRGARPDLGHLREKAV